MPVFDFVCVPEWGSGVEVCGGLWWVNFVFGSGVGAPCGGGDATVIGTVGASPEFAAGAGFGDCDVHGRVVSRWMRVTDSFASMASVATAKMVMSTGGALRMMSSRNTATNAPVMVFSSWGMVGGVTPEPSSCRLREVTFSFSSWGFVLKDDPECLVG